MNDLMRWLLGSRQKTAGVPNFRSMLPGRTEDVTDAAPMLERMLRFTKDPSKVRRPSPQPAQETVEEALAQVLQQAPPMRGSPEHVMNILRARHKAQQALRAQRQAQAQKFLEEL